MGPSLRERTLRGARGVLRRAVRPSVSVVVEARVVDATGELSTARRELRR